MAKKTAGQIVRDACRQDEKDPVRDQITQFDALRLVAKPSALSCADIFVRFTLTEWHLESTKDDAVAAATGLVRAVVGTADPKATPSTMVLRLLLSGGKLTIELEDHRPRAATLRVPSDLPADKSGVEALSQGQLVWCQLPLPVGVDASAVPLPRRGTTKAATANQPADDSADPMDPEVLQRILSALSRRRDDEPPQSAP